MDMDLIQQAFYKARDEGNDTAARYFAQQMIRMSEQNSTGKTEVPPLARVGRGMMDVGQGAKQIYKNVTNAPDAAEYSQSVSDEIKRYESDVGGGFDWLRMGGQIAATLPLGLASMPKSLFPKIAQGATQGALAGGLLATKEGDSRLVNTIGGGVAGGVGVPLASAAGAYGARFADATNRRFFQPWLNSGKVDSAVNSLESIPLGFDANLRKAAAEQLKISGKTDPATLERMARAEQYGFIGDAAPMSGQITRDPKQWTRERNLQKLDDVGDEITGRLRNQNARFMDIFDDLQKATGRSVDDVVDSGESVINAVNNRYDATQRAVGKLYQEARQQYGDVGGIRLDNLSATLDDLSDNATADKIADSVARRYKRFGLVDQDGVPTGKTLTVTQAEEFRRFIGGLSDSNDPTLRKYKRDLISRLDDDVFNSIGDDAFQTARAAASDRFKEFEQTIVDKLVNGKLGEDKAVNAIVYRHSPADLQALKGTLMNSEGGEAAWNNLRGEVIEMLNMSATQNKGRDGAFSGAAFKTALDKLGRKKLDVLFPDQADYLYGLSRVGVDMTYQPPFSSVNNSNSASTLVNYARAGGKDIPILSKLADRFGQDRRVEQALSGYPVNRTASQQDMQKWLEAISGAPPINQIYRQTAPAATAGLLSQF